MKILINGACGRMGCEIRRLLECGYRGHSFAGGADICSAVDPCIPHTLTDCGDADIIIDFSHHSAIETLCSHAAARHIPLLVASTGHNTDELALIQSTSRKIPVFLAANLSLGIALLHELAHIASAALPESDIEILEMHHNRKLDAPSGTALELAESIAQTRMNKTTIHCGRKGHALKSADEIGIHAVRMGAIIGSHTIFFSNAEETVVISHTAHTPRVYAQGAITAAEYLILQPPGLYTMTHLLNSRSSLPERGDRL